VQGWVRLDLSLVEPILAAGGSLQFVADDVNAGNTDTGTLQVDVNLIRNGTATSLVQLNDSPGNVAEQLAGMLAIPGSNQTDSVLEFIFQLSSSNGERAEFHGLTSLWLVPGRQGSFNFDTELDVSDVDQLNNAIRANSDDSLFDLNFDGLVDRLDRDHWVHDLKNTWYGDADLDGLFSTGDLVALLSTGQFEDGVYMNSTWATGDFDGDGEFGTGDLVTALSDGGYEQGPRAAASVPEPSSIWLAIGCAGIAVACWRDLAAR
jgi:hypothetical protein